MEHQLNKSNLNISNTTTEENYTSSGENIDAVIGVSVGFSITLICVITYLCYRYHTDSNEVEQTVHFPHPYLHPISPSMAMAGMGGMPITGFASVPELA